MPVRSSALRDELIAAGIPESWEETLAAEKIDRSLVVQIVEDFEVNENAEHVEKGPARVEIILPDDASEKTVAKVVKAHDPTPPKPPPSREEQAAAAIKKAKNLDEVKKALVELLGQ